jgi:hypothetical protein
MTCPMCRGVIKTIERTNPRMVTDMFQLFPRLRTGENLTTSVSSRHHSHGQHNQRPQNGSHEHVHRPTPVYRPSRPINPAPTRPPIAYRPPVINRWRAYYREPFSYVPTTRWPLPHMSPAARMLPQPSGTWTDNNGSSSRHPEWTPSREVQLLRDMARTRRRSARGWSMPDTSARSQLVRFVRTREPSQPMSRFGSQNGDARFSGRR